MPVETDRGGHRYETLLEFQSKQLALWEKLLDAMVHAGVSEYVKSVNKQADSTEEKHQVIRGQDLIQVIMDYPQIPFAFPNPAEDAFEVIAEAEDYV